MKRMFTSLVAAVAAMTVGAQNAEFFEPYKEVDLRLPSVPLVVNDPYFSIWSPYVRLTDGTTRHWTDAQKAIDGLLRVDGKTYRFMGVEKPYVLKSILPMADEGAWTAKTSRTYPGDGWADPAFDDSSWGTEKGAIGSADEYPNVHTNWDVENTDVYARRTVNLTADDIADDLYIVYSHDDVFELYINGTQVISTGETWLQGETLHLTAAHKALLKEGENVIAAHCHNTTGGAYVDFGIFVPNSQAVAYEKTAEQKAVYVLPTSSYYTFTCGPVELNVVFTAPMLMDDLDLMSTPINYVSYQARSLDKKQHDVQVYFETTPQLTINELTQPTIARTLREGGLEYVTAGSINQPYTERRGDLICIDWGHLYLTGAGRNSDVTLGDYNRTKAVFANEGRLPQGENKVVTRNPKDMPAMAYMDNLGLVDTEGNSGYLMLGYDDVYSLEYMFQRRTAYWKHGGKVSIFDAFERARGNYSTVMQRCRDWDRMIMDDAQRAGGQKYAEICAVAYRHVIAAHKLFEDEKGNLLFFSKENNSNGCINTVDLTYPSAPLFLCYNPDLLKGMMTSIFEYSASGRWNKPFPAHDLGTYPKANGQVYGGDMPIEEGGNMVILAAAISKIEGNADYAKRYWDLLTIWTDYLAENGQDPANQLCTDDFAGHWAHNANLSIKAIMGVAGYAEMARMLGMDEVADTYAAKAKDMAVKWEQDARDGDHYRLAFDRPNTWSQKYNIIWDKMWNLNIFPNNVIEKELNYYLTKQNPYGLPLDSRKEYTKSDWIMWTAAMSSDIETFQKFVDPLYKYVNETVSRVPLSDWHHTDSGEWVGFRARSVIGGYWMQVLMQKMQDK